jgi:hypothetical protein
MQLLDPLQLALELVHDRLRDRNRARLLPLAIHDRQDPFVEIEVLHAKFQALEQTEPAAIQELHDQVVRRLQVLEDRVDLLPRQDHGDIARTLRPRNVLVVAEVTFQRMTEKKQERVEGLVLG